LDGLAIINGQLGRVDDALLLKEEVLRLMKDRFGERHFHTVDASNSLAASYCVLGRLGERHPDTITALTSLGLILISMKKWDQVVKVQNDVLRLATEVLNVRHVTAIKA
ncbi:hypothetical protein M408DRAFT_46956, partial [Serendipita vermifera MAFF 305830]